jgi:hypothetical protein
MLHVFRVSQKLLETVLCPFVADLAWRALESATKPQA